MRWLIIIAIAPFLAFAQNPPVPLSQNALGTVAQILNSSSTGTTLNKLASLTGAPSKVVITTAGATGGVVGIVASGAGTAGTATVQVTGGSVPCVFDGSTTAGDYVQISASVNGDCADAGSTLPSSGQVIGRVLTTNSGVGTYKIDLNAGGGGGSSSGGGNTTICNGSASATAATCPGVPAPTTYGLGTTASPYLSGTFIPGATSSGAPLTLNIAGLGAKNVFVGGVATSASNTVTSGTPYSFQYDGTQIQVLSGGGGGSIAPCTTAQAIFFNSAASTPGCIAVVNNAVLVTSGAGVPSEVAPTSPITVSSSALACATCVTSAAALTSGAFMYGAGLQASAVLADLTVASPGLAAETITYHNAVASAVPQLILQEGPGSNSVPFPTILTIQSSAGTDKIGFHGEQGIGLAGLPIFFENANPANGGTSIRVNGLHSIDLGSTMTTQQGQDTSTFWNGMVNIFGNLNATSGTLTATSGLQTPLSIFVGFAPASGTAQYADINLQNAINQTGGASGITRGLYVNDILTAAADYRGVEVADVGSSQTAIKTGTGKVTFGGVTSAPLYATTTACASGASPAICAAAPDGSVAISTGVNPTLVVNTTAVTANSQIILTPDDSATVTTTTCNSTLATLVGGMAVTARTAGTSFTISYNGTITTNPLCVNYKIEN